MIIMVVFFLWIQYIFLVKKRDWNQIVLKWMTRFFEDVWHSYRIVKSLRDFIFCCSTKKWIHFFSSSSSQKKKSINHSITKECSTWMWINEKIRFRFFSGQIDQKFSICLKKNKIFVSLFVNIGYSCGKKGNGNDAPSFFFSFCLSITSYTLDSLW